MFNFFRNLFRSKHSKSQKKSSKKEKVNEEPEGIVNVFTPFDPNQAVGVSGNLDELRQTTLLENQAHRDRSQIRPKVRPPTFLHNHINRQAVVLKNEKVDKEPKSEIANAGLALKPENSLIEEENSKEKQPHASSEELDLKTPSPVNIIIEEKINTNDSGTEQQQNIDDDSDTGTDTDDKGRKSFSENNVPIPVVSTSVVMLAEEVNKGEDIKREQDVQRIVVEEKIINQIDINEKTPDSKESVTIITEVEVHEKEETLPVGEEEKVLDISSSDREDEIEESDAPPDENMNQATEISSKNTSEMQKPDNSIYDNITIKSLITKAPSFSPKSRQIEEPTVELREPTLSTFSSEEEKPEEDTTPIVKYREKSVIKNTPEEEDEDGNKPAWVAMALKRSSIWKDPDEDAPVVNDSKDENVENKPPKKESSENKPRAKPAINKPKPSFIPKDTAEEPLFQKNQEADIVKPSDLRKTRSIKATASPRLNRQSTSASEKPLEEYSTESNAKQTGKQSRVSSLTKKWESVR